MAIRLILIAALLALGACAALRDGPNNTRAFWEQHERWGP